MQIKYIIKFADSEKEKPGCKRSGNRRDKCRSIIGKDGDTGRPTSPSAPEKQEMSRPNAATISHPSSLRFYHSSNKLRFFFWDRFWTSSWIVSYKPTQPNLVMTLPLQHSVGWKWPTRIFPRTHRRRNILLGGLLTLLFAACGASFLINIFTKTVVTIAPTKRSLQTEDIPASETKV